MRRIAHDETVGHLGTLDPIATGVLPLVIGRATRLAQFYTRSDKVYEGVVRFGWATDTYDRAGAPTCGAKREVTLDRRGTGGAAREISRRDSADAAAGFRQESGRQARLRAGAAGGRGGTGAGEGARLRAGAARSRRARTRACARIARAAPTCARIAHELGQPMGCGAHLNELRRTASGEFEIAQARTLAQLEVAGRGRPAGGCAWCRRRSMLPGFPSVYVDDTMAAHIRHGRNFPASPFRPRRPRGT